MSKVIPFRGILYKNDRVAGDEVTAPPYDIITAEFRERLYQKSPYNIVQIDFGKEIIGDNDINNKYIRARDLLEQWIEKDIMIRDEKPSFYVYEIEYSINKERKSLKGIISLVKIEEFGQGIYPHELTHSKPKTDRLNLMKTCQANISPIYALYNSEEKITSNIIRNISGEPYISARDTDGAIHKVFKISDEASIDLITKELSDKAIFIADGHHRYEVALEYKKEMESKIPMEEKKKGEVKSYPWQYVMMFLANIADEGITILPTHRMIKGIKKEDVLLRLEPDFVIETCALECDIKERLSLERENTFGLYLGSTKKWYVLRYKGTNLKDVQPPLRDLDVVILQELIIKRDLGITDIAYEMDIEESLRKVRSGDFDAVFFLKPTKVEYVERVALAGLRMPPKSTYFYPKLLTGLVLNKFNS